MYETARKRRKGARVTDFAVHNENIDAYLRKHWRSYKRHQKMIWDLCSWWDAWEYCIDSCPDGIRRAYFRKEK